MQLIELMDSSRGSIAVGTAVKRFDTATMSTTTSSFSTADNCLQVADYHSSTARLSASTTDEVPMLRGHFGVYSATPPPINVTPVTSHPGTELFGQRSVSQGSAAQKPQGNVAKNPVGLQSIRKGNRPKKTKYVKSTYNNKTSERESSSSSQSGSLSESSTSSNAATPVAIPPSHIITTPVTLAQPPHVQPTSSFNSGGFKLPSDEERKEITARLEKSKPTLLEKLRDLCSDIIFHKQQTVEDNYNSKLMDLRPSRFVSGFKFTSYRQSFKAFNFAVGLANCGLGYNCARVTRGLLDIYPSMRYSYTTMDSECEVTTHYEPVGIFEFISVFAKGYFSGYMGYFSLVFYANALREFWNALSRYRTFEIEPSMDKLPIEDLRCDQLSGINIKHQDAQLADVTETKSVTMMVDDFLSTGSLSRVRNYKISLELLSQITGPNHFVYGQDLADTLKLMSNTARHFATINYSRYEYLMHNYGENTVHVAKHLWNHHRTMFGESGLSF